MKQVLVFLAVQCLAWLIPLGTVARAETAALGGTFLHFGYGPGNDVIPTSRIAPLLDELAALGMNTVIVAETRISRASGCPSSTQQIQWLAGFPSKLGVLLDEAFARGMEVHVGATNSSFTCGQFWSSGNTSVVVQDIQQNISQLALAHGGHPAFKGWYIPDEPGLPDSGKYHYYKSVANALRALGPGKRISVAPYFPNQPTLPTPSALGTMARAFSQNTGVDLQIWQDGIGAIPGVKLFHWTRAGHSSEQYYEALARSLGAGGLWADVEVFNYGRPLFNTPSGALTGAYRSASAQRINQQLWSARFASRRVSWLHQWHTSPLMGPDNGYVEAPLLHGTYRGIYGLGATSVLPLNHANYTWQTPPAAQYPDTSGYGLFDRRTGDPRNPQDPAWIGIQGAVRATVDLGAARRVDWVGVHLLSRPSWGIRIPPRLDIYCGASTASLVLVGQAHAPFSQSDQDSVIEEEYLMGNHQPLGVSCRYLQLRMPSTGNWVFISEVELAAER